MIGGLANAALESLMFRVLIKTTINAGKGLPIGSDGPRQKGEHRA